MDMGVSMNSEHQLKVLLRDIRACRHCEAHLSMGPRPVVAAGKLARILIIGQAPGLAVHQSGVPWDDPSGNRLRQWLGVDRDLFYDANRIAIVPMGFCYPGRGKSGDLPPRPECAPLWHKPLLEQLNQIQLTLLIGQYAQGCYLDQKKRTLTDTVKSWRDHVPSRWPLPHPSPRNRFWLAKNPWFEKEVIPALQLTVQEVLNH